MADIPYFQTWAELNDLSRSLDWSEFGKVCQCLLAIAFKSLGYSVSHFQFIGRPDFVAEKPPSNLSVEAKSSLGRSVVIKRQDILGIEGLGHTPVVAVLTYPDLTTRWLIVETCELSARTYSKTELTAFSRQTVEQEVSEAFSSIISLHKTRALQGASRLAAIVRE